VPEEALPRCAVNAAVQDRAVRQALGYAVDRNRINEIAARGTSFEATASCRRSTRPSYQQPAQDYPLNPDKANQILDAAGWVRSGGGPRTKGGEQLSFNLYVRSESTYNIQAAKLVAEEAGAVGSTSTSRWSARTSSRSSPSGSVNGKPAPDFDTFIWGWGGDPLRPSFCSAC